MEPKSRKWVGHAAIIATNLIFGVNPNCAKALVPHYITPFTLTGLRMLFGAAVFWLLSLFAKKEHVDRRSLRVIFAGAVCGLVGTQLAFAAALLYVSPSYISLISAMGPLVVMILSAVFLKEPVSAKKVFGVVFGIGGALMIILFSITPGGGPAAPGYLLCFLNITFYAVYLLVTRTVSQRYSPVTLMKWMFLFSALVCVPLGVPGISRSPVLAGGAPAAAVLDLAVVLVLATVVAYFLVPKALHYLRPTTVSIYSNLQPVVTSTMAILVGQDVFTWNKPAALALIGIGVYLATTSRARADLT